MQKAAFTHRSYEATMLSELNLPNPIKPSFSIYLLLHRLIGLYIIKKHLVAVLPGITEGVDKEGRFAGLVESLWHVDLVHKLVIDEERDAIQVATDPNAIDIFGR